jgi:pulcherriminic acid synthase
MASEKGHAPGRNAVEIRAPLGGRGGYYRSYEVYQRQRVRDATPLINGRVFLQKEFLRNPYPTLKILRDNYPFYRDWVGNCDWTVLYNDVTSVFVDDYNFETRSKRWFYFGDERFGRDLREELPVLLAAARAYELFAPAVAEELIEASRRQGQADLVGDLFAKFDIHILASALDLPRQDFDRFGAWYRAMMDGWHWNPQRELAGKQAIAAFTEYIRPLFAARRKAPGEDIISAIAALNLDGGATTPEDVTATILEGDGQTLRGGLANMWFQLLAHPEQIQVIRDDHLLVKHAWQETLRHSTPVLHAKRFALHEVERFGRLIPEGGLVMVSAAAGNRDDRIFSDPDRFDVQRKDLCFREPRGQYRADGLPAGIAFGPGKPSRHPAVPEDRPRSLYALTMEAALTVSHALLAAFPRLRLADGAQPEIFCRWPGDMHTCWELTIVSG